MPDHPSAVLVIDTNIVLDLLVFRDPACDELRICLDSGACRWVATDAMREELLRVLAYPQIALRMNHWGKESAGVLRTWDERVHLVPAAPRAGYRCKDDDDQKFIDLAVAHQAVLLSKDKAVLAMARRLSKVGARVLRAFPPLHLLRT